MITIKEIEQKQEELNKMVAELKKQKQEECEFWTPKHKELYYFLNSCGEVMSLIYYGSSADDERIASGNCYRTEELAEHARDKAVLLHQLEVACYKNKPTESDWESTNIAKYCLSCDTGWLVNLRTTIYFKTRIQGAIYTKNEQDLIDFIEEHGEEKIKRLLF